jgi:hypothetical protein
VIAGDFSPVIQPLTRVCRAGALAASAVLAGPAAATVGDRQILGGCEVRGGVNDIYS